MQPQGRANHDYGSARVVHSLTKQVLAKTPLLAFDHIGQRFQWPLVRTGNCATTTTVIQQRINSFLKHALFVPNNDVRRVEIQQTLESVVSIDYATIQIV